MAEQITELDYLSFHKQFAVSHAKLKHLSDGRISFLGFDEMEMSQHRARTGNKTLGEFIMLMEPPAGRLVGDSDMISDEILAGFSILGAIKDVETTNVKRIHEVASECKVIGFQILQRMKKVSNGQVENSCSQVAAIFNLNQVTYEPVRHLDIVYHGYLFRYPLRSKTPLTYSDAVWQ